MPPPPQLLKESGAGPSRYQISLRSDHSFFKNNSFFLSFFRINLITPPQLPQRERISSGNVNHVSRTIAYFSTKFHPDLSTLSVFQDFRFPLQLPPMSPDSVGT